MTFFVIITVIPSELLCWCYT